ncbi:oxysterol-binding protein-related protein 6-like isoform X2 [Oppia nitens]|uniref:oxysterol-binding protein-related protein 6-like isoform X2 n=1 Tax=Oppia nitens TaxID=1686743 RepID=UPI0023DCE530|nr:oxysterol-binding protein-related protein 6-like isoform X2 [Oppia nitens]
MSATAPPLNHAINICNTVLTDLSTQSQEAQSLQHTSDSSASTVSQENDNRKSGTSLPIITRPNGIPINGVKEKHDYYEESDKSVHSSQKTSTKTANEWEILEGLKDGQRCEERPNKFDGYLLKRRKWPLKGWHKRHFHLENGILSYSKSPNDMMKGKIHGSVDVGLSVISTKRSSKRIDIDAEEFIYHLKVKNRMLFMKWVQMLRHHRLFRQHEIAFGNRINAISSPIRSIISSTTTTPEHEMNSKVIAWILDSSHEKDTNATKELNDLQLKLVKLSSLLKVIEMEMESKTNNIPSETVGLKKRRRFLLRRKKQNNTTNTVNDKSHKKADKNEINAQNSDTLNIMPSNNLKPLPIGHHLSSSHPVLNETSLAPNGSPSDWMTQSCNEADIDFKDTISIDSLKSTKAITEFVIVANDVNNNFRSLYRSLQRNDSFKRKKSFTGKSRNTDNDLVYSLRQSLSEALQQNKELKSLLERIHEQSDVLHLSSPIPTEAVKIVRAMSVNDVDDEQTVIHEPLAHSASRDSTSVLSISEYFDAEENLSACTTSTEDEDEESLATDLSDDGTEYRNLSKASTDNINTIGNTTGRRSKLPAPQPDTGDVSLWSLLCKNIGKDLSKISMPVTINEPLNVLQRLCEELEYSELLDKAAAIEDSHQRMLQIAAFAVSSYSSAYYRAGHKPFNPLLGETYESIREDKGFKFISEQVSHHPPVSACRADSDNYIFWQDMRIKSKFWGKSMEIIPFGTVHVLLKPSNAHYRWNKVTTCVHNLFKGQRWVDNYGELTITDGELTCRLTFEKASYWSNKKHEINGVLLNANGDIIDRLFGKWNESLHCGTASGAKCIWRPGAMPEDYELYYGFSRFAIELNELTPELRKLLPPTDTRYRPDQRLLEEGNIQNAETIKLQLEQQQRERRRMRENNGQLDKPPNWFRKEIMSSGDDIYHYNDKYWEYRDKGFEGIDFEKLW